MILFHSLHTAPYSESHQVGPGSRCSPPSNWLLRFLQLITGFWSFASWLSILSSKPAKSCHSSTDRESAVTAAPTPMATQAISSSLARNSLDGL
ncbi:hypothetical protein P175DRAFT_0253453 [Aspergillus ochraceoroseus IBT 24754]|uniref:Uncharacterized protein n=1 Tax=Aspergillus ochraceoroseus IBT 24754 TaxID=1392256 RepID=A0A2T5LYD9_9EURO|nr:uncharacterized protein P175DRAFT_0253453 [Aspergillus ochraceoroseus IBT 24754]PTU21273.1 hypothetical protein P175DRAFT_0253453 [Aspergillus ochraceoroseus IBT 24754]